MLKINDTFKKLIPPLSTDEYSALETSIVKEGVRDAIVTWQGFIIDGHNRFEIATRHGLSYKTISKEFSSEDDVIIWMIDNQLARRNISDFNRTLLAIVQGEIFSKRARENIVTAAKIGGHIRQNSPLTMLSKGWIQEKPTEIPVEKPVINPVNVRKEVAKIAGVSEGTVSKVKAIEAKATPETKAKLSRSEMSINEAYKEVRAVEKRAERIETIQKQMVAIEAGELPELKGLYDVVAIDPPWPYEGENKSITSYDANGRRVANPYPEMSIEQIKNIELPLTDNSIVFLWTTHKFLPDAFDILKEWGMEYKATLVWDKQKIGMGAWLRMQCEFCLVGIKGKPYWDNTTYRDILSEARREHSRKPDGFFDMVDAITMGRKLEYFSREKRKGWEVFGNDTGKF